jgi:hypothetical protein
MTAVETADPAPLDDARDSLMRIDTSESVGRSYQLRAETPTML